ncbi:hypothetical protein M0804_002644 [Polistes exclamans]|nr:hypothetical protein M0804_002644 [Polistes exclamans]
MGQDELALKGQAEKEEEEEEEESRENELNKRHKFGAEGSRFTSKHHEKNDEAVLRILDDVPASQPASQPVSQPTNQPASKQTSKQANQDVEDGEPSSPNNDTRTSPLRPFNYVDG